MSPPKFDIFLFFCNFPRSQILSSSATREATRIPSFLYLWWIGPAPNLLKLQKNMTRVVVDDTNRKAFLPSPFLVEIRSPQLNSGLISFNVANWIVLFFG